jgi:hypothetical protein
MNNIIDMKYILLLYLLQLSSITNNTLGHQLKEYVYSNRIIQHIINIIFIFVVISLDKTKSIQDISKSSLAIYLIYLLSTKLDLQYNLIILIIFLFYYFYKRELEQKNERLLNDKDLNLETKNLLIYLDKYKINIINVSIIIGLIYSINYYYQRKNIQYGGGFSYTRFLLY